MRPFDPIESPLRGSCLIEAGAGTGKTYTITTLVLRLLLEEALTVEQILIVTFTTAAAAELRDRLRRRLRDAKYVLQGRGCDDGDLDRLIARGGPREIAIQRLEDALANFDRMPVFTIHGFCQRVLSEMAFETGSDFEAELVTDAQPFIQALAEDFWRRTWHQAPPEVMSLVSRHFKTPADLAEVYGRWAGPEIDLLPREEALSTVSCETYRSLWNDAGRQWRQDKETLLAELTNAELKANVYGRPQPPDGDPRSPSPRQEKLAAWACKVDRWTRSQTAALPPPDDLLYFSQSKLEASLKKGATPLSHVFFETCDRVRMEAQRLETAIQRWLVLLQVRFFRHVEEGLAKIKREKQVLFFDDLLLMVRNALVRDDGGTLKQKLRSRYRAALIDEFQDTDRVQYTIFNRLFGTDHLLFMIGDPKQAIYSFRGADIFTYLDAARKADHRFTLTRNWRSTPDLVRAANTLFGGSRSPFLWPEITFRPASPALNGIPGSLPGAPLTVWFLDKPANGAGQASWSKPSVSAAIGSALVREIGQLQNAGAGGRDMAILVRTNRQARDMQQFLAEARIPAVVYYAGSVFHRAEALDLRRLLVAIMDPGDEAKVRTALSSPFFARTGNELDFDEPAPEWWESTVERFFTYRDQWFEEDFIRMFRRFTVAEEVAPRLLAGPWGERRLTNVLHLMELLHQASVDRRLGPGELIQWLDRQRVETGEPAETHQIRLENDEDAVTIMTVHKSKGLEFPIVFYPFAWEGIGAVSAPALCHDFPRSDRRVLDFGSADLEKHLAAMAEERMAEELRLLYVAVTRARNRCYLVWGKLPTTAFSALTYLMDPECGRGTEAHDWDAVQSMAQRFEKRDADALRRQLAALAHASDGTIEGADLPDCEPFCHRPVPSPPELAPPRLFGRGPLPVWRLASFSSLVHQRPEEGIGEGPVERRDADPSSLENDGTVRPGALIGPIADFEASARAGLFFHDVMESIDFAAPTTDLWGDLIDERLQSHGFARDWAVPVRSMLQRVVAAPLPAAEGGFLTLRQIATVDRLTELEFHLPLRAFDAVSLARAFDLCRQPAFHGQLPDLVEHLDFRLSGGYLKGFIDLIFRHGGRYYIADWKSNLLGAAFDAYRPGRLAEVMAAHYYFLQYHLYTLALDRYLRVTSPGYRYDHDFGGVFYCFIRGMGGPAGDPTGIFFDRPAETLVRRLEHLIALNGEGSPSMESRP